MTPEGRIKASIVRLLRAAGAKVLLTTGVAEVGTPDIVACLRGRCICIEVKRPGAKARPIQLARLAEWRQAGAVTLVAWEAKQVQTMLEIVTFSESP